MVPPALTYRARLRTEGLTLAACGAVGCVLLVVADERATRDAASTAGQLAVVLLLLAVLGPLGVRRALAASELDDWQAATGEPTPLWHLPLVVAVLSLPLVALGAWDAALRVTGGCVLVGLAQALLLAQIVGADQRATGRVHVRAPGSRILRGTRLTHAPPRA